MKSLFDSSSREAMLARLDALRPDSPRGWGKMVPAQALAHLVPPLEIAVGARAMKRVFLGRLIGRLVLNRALSDAPWGHGAPTDKSFVVRDARDFVREQAKVRGLLERFGSGGPEGVTREPHLFFGSMTPEEWDLLTWKHVDHHLRQFGA